MTAEHETPTTVATHRQPPAFGATDRNIQTVPAVENSIRRGKSSPDEVIMEISTQAASWP